MTALQCSEDAEIIGQSVTELVKDKVTYLAVQDSKKRRYCCEYHTTFDIVELKLAGKHCTRISSSSYDKHLIEGQSGIDRPTDQLDYF